MCTIGTQRTIMGTMNNMKINRFTSSYECKKITAVLIFPKKKYQKLLHVHVPLILDTQVERYFEIGILVFLSCVKFRSTYQYRFYFKCTKSTLFAVDSQKGIGIFCCGVRVTVKIKNSALQFCLSVCLL